MSLVPRGTLAHQAVGMWKGSLQHIGRRDGLRRFNPNSAVDRCLRHYSRNILPTAPKELLKGIGTWCHLGRVKELTECPKGRQTRYKAPPGTPRVTGSHMANLRDEEAKELPVSFREYEQDVPLQTALPVKLLAMHKAAYSIIHRRCGLSSQQLIHTVHRVHLQSLTGINTSMYN